MPNRHERRVGQAVGKKSVTPGLKTRVNIKDTNLVFPPDIKPVFSDGLFVQFGGEIVLLSFLKTTPTLKENVQPSEIETRCVAQVAITPAQIADNLKILNNQFMVFASAQDDEAKNFLLEKAGMKEPK
jgi:hypothetical protein